MSQVLWTNTLINQKLETDSSDLFMLNKFSKKLDEMTRKAGVLPFTSLLDSTDLMVNYGQLDLPENMQSTDQLMIEAGQWVTGEEAVEILERLITIIQKDNIKFGMINNNQQEVLEELSKGLIAARRAAKANGFFNFALVM